MSHLSHMIQKGGPLFIAVFFLVGSSALAAFVEPTVPATGGNVFSPLHIGNAPQIKIGNFGANRFTTTGKLCFGPNACISAWWDTAPNTCHLEVKKVNSNSTLITEGFGGVIGGGTCNDILTAETKDAGWVAVGSARCATVRHINNTFDSDEAVCGLPSTCIFMRMKCGGSVITEIPTVSPAPGVENHPVPGFTQ